MNNELHKRFPSYKLPKPSPWPNRILSVVVGSVLLVAFFFILIKGVDRQETYECAKWAVQAEEYPNFYYTDWQKAQCNIK